MTEPAGSATRNENRFCHSGRNTRFHSEWVSEQDFSEEKPRTEFNYWITTSPAYTGSQSVTDAAASISLPTNFNVTSNFLPSVEPV